MRTWPDKNSETIRYVYNNESETKSDSPLTWVTRLILSNNNAVLEILDAGLGSNVRQVSIEEPDSGVGNGLRIEGNLDGLILTLLTSTSPPLTDTPGTNSDSKYV